MMDSPPHLQTAQRAHQGQDWIEVPLYRLAHGRSGDKGDRSNISVIAWNRDCWPVLVEQLTEQRVGAHFASRRPQQVRRYLLAPLQAMNWVLDGVLDGGVNDALNLDSHGKALSYWLLDMRLHVPRSVLPFLAPEHAVPTP